jgi:hypothetical protein
VSWAMQGKGVTLHTTRKASHVTRHTSPVTRHTSYVTHDTSHKIEVTRLEILHLQAAGD